MGHRNHANWIKAYIEHTRFSESPNSFHFWTAIGTVAGALRRKVWIDEFQFQWTPNFYIVLVGPPGVAAKSTSIRQGLRLLEEVEGVYFGPQSMTWQSLTESLQNSQEHVDVPGQADPEIMSCITISVSELGTFLDPKNTELVDVLVDMWDGQRGTWRRTTKTSGNTTIHNPWLNILACTTPAWLRANFPEHLVGGGLTSRVVFVYADRKRQLIAYPSDYIDPGRHSAERRKLVEDLQQIGSLVGPYSFDPLAKEWGRAWYTQLWNDQARRTAMQSDRFDGYCARKQTHIHKLAMVLAAAKRNQLIITLEDITEAEATITALEGDMARVFESIGVSETAAKSNSMLVFIRNAKVVDQEALYRACYATMTSAEFVEGLKANIQAGYIKVVNLPGGKKEFHYIPQPDDIK